MGRAKKVKYSYYGNTVWQDGIYVAFRTNENLGNGFLRKYDFDGTLLWTAAGLSSTETVLNTQYDYVYAGAVGTGGQYYKINKSDGTQIWATASGTNPPSSVDIERIIAIDSESITSQPGSAPNDIRRWSSDGMSNPWVADYAVAAGVGYYNDVLYAIGTGLNNPIQMIDANTGIGLGSSASFGARDSRIIMDSSGLYYTTSRPGGFTNVCAYNVSDNSEKWLVGLGSRCRVLTKDSNFIYVGSDNGNVTKLNKSDGSTVSVLFTLPGGKRVTALDIDNDGNLYAATDLEFSFNKFGALYKYNSSGVQQWAKEEIGTIYEGLDIQGY